MTTLIEARTFIGDDRLWLTPGGTEKVLVGVTVVDARMGYGRAQLRVQPLAGRGLRWVDVDSTLEVDD